MPSPIKRARKRKRGSGILPVLIMICLVAVVILSMSVVNSFKQGGNNINSKNNSGFEFKADAAATAAPLVLQATAIPERTGNAAASPTIAPDVKIDNSNNANKTEIVQNPLVPKPLAQEGYLPVYDRALRTQDDAPMISIIITGCTKPERMNDLVSIADKYNAKFTLFPYGSALLTNGMSQAFKLTVEKLGWEIEGCSFSHKKEFQITGGELELEMWKQSIAVSYALGADYKEHFYLPYSNNGTSDLRTHYYAGKLGFEGICGYTYSYINMYKEGALASTLGNGNIYEFDMTDKAWGVLQSFMESANAKGYRMVTMNELFGHAPNSMSNRLTIDVQELPEIPDFSGEYYDLKLNDHCHAVMALQRRLIELHYMTPETRVETNENGIAKTVVVQPQADGIYGSATSIAVSAFQAHAGLAATGNADIDTQKAIFEINAPMGG